MMCNWVLKDYVTHSKDWDYMDKFKSSGVPIFE